MFFRQKKETKRKISFFMAAALVFSLIPAPSIANAAGNANVTLQGSVSNATIKINGGTVTSGNSVSISEGKATIVVEAKDGYMFNSADDVTLNTDFTGEPDDTTGPSPTTGSATSTAPDTTDAPSAGPANTPTTGPTDAPTTGPSAPVSPSATTSDNTDGNSEEAAAYSLRETVTGKLDETKKTITFTLNSVTQNILVKLSGSATADHRQYTVKFTNKLTKAAYEAKCDGIILGAENSVTGGSIVSLTVNANANCVFKDNEAPVVMVNDNKKDLTANETNTSYSVNGGITITAGTTVVISGKAYEKYKVTIKDTSSTLKNATLTATYNNKGFTGGDVLEGDAVTLKITPKEGHAFNDAPVVKAGTEIVSGLEKIGGGAYSAEVTIKAATELSVSGTAELQKLTDASPDDNANNASLAETDFTDSKVLGSFLNAFANDKSISTEKADEIKAAVDKNEAYIQAALSVTGASAEAKTEASNLIKENAGLGINADNLSDDNAAFLDITLASICKKVSDNTTMASIIVEELDNKIAVTMDLPNFTATPSGKDRKYIVIRIHGSKAEKLPDADITVTGTKIKFLSDKFSTYVITFEDTDKTTPTAAPGNTTKPVVPPAYNPGGSVSTSTATPVPSATASAEPSKAPDAAQSPAPGTTDTTKPSEKPAEPGTTDEPVSTPDATKQPATGTGNSSKVKVGKNVTISNTKYKVTSVSGTKAVQFTGAKKNAKKVVIPSAVKVGGKKFKVTSIANNALKGNKKVTKLTIGANINKIGKNAFNGCSSLKSITIKSKKLTAKKTGKNAFKGINKKAVIKVPKAKTKAYKKIIKAKGAPKTVKIKK